jgi:hypothetical protein
MDPRYVQTAALARSKHRGIGAIANDLTSVATMIAEEARAEAMAAPS